MKTAVKSARRAAAERPVQFAIRLLVLAGPVAFLVLETAPRLRLL